MKRTFFPARTKEKTPESKSKIREKPGARKSHPSPVFRKIDCGIPKSPYKRGIEYGSSRQKGSHPSDVTLRKASIHGRGHFRNVLKNILKKRDGFVKLNTVIEFGQVLPLTEL